VDVPDDALNPLSTQLHGPAPDALRELSPDELADLAAALAEARHRQAAALSEAGDRALSHIPRLLRGPIRRMVG
jgi:predicted DNA-binding transcriptional regulator YafY